MKTNPASRDFLDQNTVLVLALATLASWTLLGAAMAGCGPLIPGAFSIAAGLALTRAFRNWYRAERPPSKAWNARIPEDFLNSEKGLGLGLMLAPLFFMFAGVALWYSPIDVHWRVYGGIEALLCTAFVALANVIGSPHPFTACNTTQEEAWSDILNRTAAARLQAPRVGDDDWREAARRMIDAGLLAETASGTLRLTASGEWAREHDNLRSLIDEQSSRERREDERQERYWRWLPAGIVVLVDLALLSQAQIRNSGRELTMVLVIQTITVGPILLRTWRESRKVKTGSAK